MTDNSQAALELPAWASGMPRRVPAANGQFRRTIFVEAKSGVALAELEDDFHRFGATVHYSGGRVTAVHGRATRYPWSTCPAAAEPLRTLVGITLSQAPDAIYRHTDGRLQCTHLFEVTGLAIAQAARGDGRNLYEITVTDPTDGMRKARLWRDKSLLLDWMLRDETISSADRFDGMTFKSVGQWAAEHGLDANAESAMILRRAARLSVGRLIDVDALPDAASMNRSGICHSFQPSNARVAKRMLGSQRDFDRSGQIPLGDFARSDGR